MIDRLLYIVWLLLCWPLTTVAQQSTAPLPPSVDLTKSKYFPPLIDQQGASCAQAAGIGYLFTYEVNRLRDTDAAASSANRYSYLYAWNMINDGEDQGDFVSQGLFLAQRTGIMTEADYGTSGRYDFKWVSGYDKYYRGMDYRTKRIVTFTDSVEQMKQWLADHGDGSRTGGLLCISAYARGWKFINTYNGPSITGYHCLLTDLGTDGAHALTIAGYDDRISYTDQQGVQRTGAFIVVNTWGNLFGDNGRFYLPYHFFRDKQRNKARLGETVTATEVQQHTPTHVIRLTIDFTSRDDLEFRIATNLDHNAQGQPDEHGTMAFRHAGGDHPMRGTQDGSLIEIAIDITDIVPKGSKPETFYLNVIKGFAGKQKGNGKVVEAELTDYTKDIPTTIPCITQMPVILNDGTNHLLFRAVESVRTTASPYTYTTADGKQTDRAFRIRTADGKRGKMHIVQQTGKDAPLIITYQLQP